MGVHPVPATPELRHLRIGAAGKSGVLPPELSLAGNVCGCGQWFLVLASALARQRDVEQDPAAPFRVRGDGVGGRGLLGEGGCHPAPPSESHASNNSGVPHEPLGASTSTISTTARIARRE